MSQHLAEQARKGKRKSCKGARKVQKRCTATDIKKRVPIRPRTACLSVDSSTAIKSSSPVTPENENPMAQALLRGMPEEPKSVWHS